MIPDKNVHDEKSWEEIALRLITIPPQRVEEGQEPIKFIGDSIFAQRTSSVTPVILVSKSNNEEGIESVRHKLHEQEVQNAIRRIDEVALLLGGPSCKFRKIQTFRCPSCCCNFCPMCFTSLTSKTETEGCAIGCLKKRNIIGQLILKLII